MRGGEALEASIRVRIRNTALGAVELSSDGGRTWSLAARLTVPALDASTDASLTAQGIGPSSPDGIVVALGSGRRLRLLPDKAGSVARDTFTIRPGQALSSLDAIFRLGPVKIGMENAGRAVGLHDGYSPADGDVLLFAVSAPPANLAQAAQVIGIASAAYSRYAAASHLAQGNRPLTGTLTLTANLPPFEQPPAVTFLLDGVPVAIINRPPYTVRWDSRDWQNGEHLIEARALGPAGEILTRKKALVLVKNGGPDG